MKQYDFVLKDEKGTARDGSDLQETLKNFFEDDLESGSYGREHVFRFEEYDDQGEKALAVFADDTEIGSITGDDVDEVSALIARASSSKLSLCVNGYDIDEYEKIIDRYKDKKFWKEEDPDFDDKAVNKAYNDLMNGLKEEKVYQAMLKFSVEDEKDGLDDEALEAVVAEERQQQENMELFLKYFRILFPLSIAVLVMGFLFLLGFILKMRWGSLMVGAMNIMFGALGAYFSRKYTKQASRQKEKKKQ